MGPGLLWRQCWPAGQTSDTVYAPGGTEKLYLPSAPVAVERLTGLPLPSVPLRLMVQPERTGSPASLEPLAFLSWNLMPLLVAGLKLPKMISCFSPDVPATGTLTHWSAFFRTPSR